MTTYYISGEKNDQSFQKYGDSGMIVGIDLNDDRG